MINKIIIFGLRVCALIVAFYLISFFTLSTICEFFELYSLSDELAQFMVILIELQLSLIGKIDEITQEDIN